MDTVKINSGNTKMIAHRGLSGIERENTCAAFVAAGNRSYFGIETDIHVTKDGKFVIIHDETTEGVTLGKQIIDVEKADFSEVENLILPDRDGAAVRRDLKLPLLEEYISICQKYEKKCVLEIKNYFKEADLERMVEVINEMGYTENVIFISFVLENCIKVRELLPGNDIQFLTAEEITDELTETLLKYRLNLDILYTRLNKENIATLHSKGIKVNGWTCDNKDEAEKLASLGIDFITTNILE